MSWLTSPGYGVSFAPRGETGDGEKQVYLHLLRRQRVPFCYNSILPNLHLVTPIPFFPFPTYVYKPGAYAIAIYVALETTHQRLLPSC